MEGRRLREEDLTGLGLVSLFAGTTLVPALTAWDDVRYTALSVAVVGFVVTVTACHAVQVRRIYSHSWATRGSDGAAQVGPRHCVSGYW